MNKSWKLSERLSKLPPYLFAEIDAMKQKEIEAGREVIDLGVGDPDQPTPKFIVEAMSRMLDISRFHRYPSYIGQKEFRESVSRWIRNRYGVQAIPENEIITLIGSKEGIAHFPEAFINPGDKVLIPDPGYPVYFSGTVFAEGNPVKFPLKQENNFLPDLKELEPELKTAKMIFLNYPNNPTSAGGNDSFFRDLIDLAHKYGFIIAHDAAYLEIYFNNDRPKSILEFEGGKEVSIEFHSLSKTFNMTGWRIGFAVGNRDLVNGLGQIKKNIDSGVFGAIQAACINALDNGGAVIDDIRFAYLEKKKILEDAIEKAGLELVKSNYTFYLWIKCPDKFNSMKFTKHLLKQCSIISTPGIGFGEYGDGYIRFSLTCPMDDIKKAAEFLKIKL
ncbi:MAG TPA: aminotransferase class I/II-fold pyridoxal phosphate-dependent enzyme [Firmicutes bacterium]|nr:aminotransferase class I/II-fold pyridoxal phosphate-dependent enzyme [Bacillota bacterium]